MVGKKESAIWKNNAVVIKSSGSGSGKFSGELFRSCAMRKKTNWGVEMAKLRQPSEHMVLGKPFAAELQIFFKPAGESATRIAKEKTASKIQLENTFKVISDATERSIG